MACHLIVSGDSERMIASDGFRAPPRFRPSLIRLVGIGSTPIGLGDELVEDGIGFIEAVGAYPIASEA